MPSASFVSRNWTISTLGAECQIFGGGTPSRAKPEYFGGDIPWATPTDITALESRHISTTRETVTEAGLNNSSAKLLPAGSVLLTSRATIGFTAVADVPIATNQGFANFICGPRLLPEFLAYWLPTKKEEMLRLAGGTTFKEISKSSLRRMPVPVPPLAEQRRIVDILSRAEGIVRLQCQAAEKAREIIPALFLDMFGDPARNPKAWPVTSLGRHVEIASVVRTPNVASEAEMLCIGPDSIASQTGQIISRPLVGDVKPKSGKYRFATGDVLYSKIRPYLAKAALADTEGYCSADMYPLRCKEYIRPAFLCALLLTRAFTGFASAESVRAQMPKLNRETLFAYRFPLPPFDLQERFAQRVAELRSVQIQQENAARNAESVLNALLAQSFAQG